MHAVPIAYDGGTFTRVASWSKKMTGLLPILKQNLRSYQENSAGLKSHTLQRLISNLLKTNYITNSCMFCAVEHMISMRLQAGMNGAEGSRPGAAALRAALSASSPSISDEKKKQMR